MQWATYYGGSSNDEGYGVACDTTGNVYLCGGGGSANNIATSGSYQDTIARIDISSVYLAKFNSDGLITWATYFGLNTGGSAATSCICDKENNIYIAGSVSDTGIYATPGCYKSSDGYGDHAFVAKFDSGCHLKWSTYFGGDSVDYAYGVVCDDSSNVYITGLTNSANGIASTGAYQPVYSGGFYDAFLAKFNDTGAFQWATYYGGSGNDEALGIASDGARIYITGNTSSSSNIATAGSYQAANMGGLDAFLAVFNPIGNLLWGTYYGGSSEDVGAAVACDHAGNAYIAGYTASQNHIATLNSYPDDVTDSFKSFLIKFDTGATGVKAIPKIIKEARIYPSPNTGVFTLSAVFADNYSGHVSVIIMNEEGQHVYSTFATAQNGTLNKKININATVGLYIVRIQAGNEIQTLRFIIEQ